AGIRDRGAVLSRVEHDDTVGVFDHIDVDRPSRQPTPGGEDPPVHGGVPPVRVLRVDVDGARAEPCNSCDSHGPSSGGVRDTLAVAYKIRKAKEALWSGRSGPLVQLGGHQGGCPGTPSLARA